ncbi:hypothetical protein LEMLEM_LOCUS11409 [Lemmus lemmus]
MWLGTSSGSCHVCMSFTFIVSIAGCQRTAPSLCAGGLS